MAGGNGSGVQAYQIQSLPDAGFLVADNNLSDVGNYFQAFNHIQTNAQYVPSPEANVILLDDSRLGGIASCSNSVNSYIELPTPDAVGFMQVRWLGTGLGSGLTAFLIVNGGGLINGQSLIGLGVGDWVNLFCDGANWWIQSYFMMPISFSASLGDPVSVTGGGFTSIIYDTVDFNIGASYDSVTGLFTPLFPGKYFVQSMNTLSTSGASGVVTYYVDIIHSTLSGNIDSQLVKTENLLTSTSGTLGGSQIINMNGFSDSLSVKVYQDSSGSPSLSVGAGNFSATRISLY